MNIIHKMVGRFIQFGTLTIKIMQRAEDRTYTIAIRWLFNQDGSRNQ
jgi:hypothetical protein